MNDVPWKTPSLSTCSSVDETDKVSDGPKYQILSLAFHSNDRGPSTQETSKYILGEGVWRTSGGL